MPFSRHRCVGDLHQKGKEQGAGVGNGGWGVGVESNRIERNRRKKTKATSNETKRNKTKQKETKQQSGGAKEQKYTTRMYGVGIGTVGSVGVAEYS